MAFLIRILMLAAAVAVIVWLVRQIFPFGRSKCGSCRHCAREFEDGTLCTFGARETFKNSVHVANCADWEAKRGGDGSR